MNVSWFILREDQVGSVVPHEERGEEFFEILEIQFFKGGAFESAMPFQKLLSATILFEGVTYIL